MLLGNILRSQAKYQIIMERSPREAYSQLAKAEQEHNDSQAYLSMSRLTDEDLSSLR